VRVGRGREHNESYGATPSGIDDAAAKPFAGSEREALRRTMMTAGRTIFFSALTVAVALGSLLVFPQPFIYSIGIGGAVCSLVAVLTALVALPALLAALGPRVNAGAPKRWRRAAERTARLEQGGFWYRLTQIVMRRPLIVAILSSALLLAIGASFLRIHFIGTNSHTIPPSLGAYKADAAFKSDFATTPSATISLKVTAPASAGAAVRSYADGLGRIRDVAFVGTPVQLRDGLWQIDIRPWTDGLSDESVDLVKTIRDLKAPYPVTTAGESSGFIDQQATIKSHIPWALAILIVATLVILFLMTGSAVLPVKSLLMNLLTISAALGVLVLVFEDGRLESLLDYKSLGAIDSSQPILIVAIAFGLSTDYAVFLLTRISEARSAGASDNEAVAIGLQRTGRIVTQAALLFCVAVGAFVSSKVIFIKEVGLGMITAVAIDSTIVRGLLVPSLMAMLGSRNWWAPGPLRRLHEKIGLSES
jgi:RND superfamily putative drug exporter